jgi:hypothetical protein
LLKVSHKTILELVKTGEIAFAIRNQDRSLRSLLRLADVEGVRSNYEQAVGSRELAKQLGVDHSAISQLVQEGLLRKKSRRTVDGYRAAKFDVHSARGYLTGHDEPT